MNLGSATLRAALTAAVARPEAPDAPAAPRERPLRLGPSLLDVFGLPGMPSGTSGSEGAGEDGLAFALRRSADAVLALQRAVVDAGAELVLAPTTATTAPALHATGQAYRAAALTAVAVDLTRDAVLAAGRPAWVLGEVPAGGGARGLAEAKTHVERLLASSIDGLWVHGDEAAAVRELCAFGADRTLPVLVEIAPALAPHAASFGAAAVVVRDDDVDAMARALTDLRAAAPALPVGARVLTPFAPSDQQQAQLLVAAAWSVLAPLSLAILGVGGSAAVAALPAVVELSRASRIRP